MKHACGGASKKALELLSSVAAADKDLATLPPDEQIRNGNTDCYLCPKCKFGPVAHQACSDLTSHHRQYGYNNSCPECGFLAKDISEWIRVSGAAPAAAVRWEHLDLGFWRTPDRWTPTAVVPRRWRPHRAHPRDREVASHLELLLNSLPQPLLPIEGLLEPSYWDAPIFRMMQEARRVAISNHLRLAIADGSEASGAGSQLENEGDDRLWQCKQLRVT